MIDFMTVSFKFDTEDERRKARHAALLTIQSCRPNDAQLRTDAGYHFDLAFPPFDSEAPKE